MAPFTTTRGRCHVKKRVCVKRQDFIQFIEFIGRKLPQLIQSWCWSWAWTCVLFMCVSVLCWPSWVCRSCEHLPQSVLGQCALLLKSCGPAWVQKLGDPVEHWTNSGVPPHWLRPPQTLPIAGGPWQPNDGHSAEFPTQSSSEKVATRHSAGQHTGSEPQKIREFREENRNSKQFRATVQKILYKSRVTDTISTTHYNLFTLCSHIASNSTTVAF